MTKKYCASAKVWAGSHRLKIRLKKKEESVRNGRWNDIQAVSANRQSTIVNRLNERAKRETVRGAVATRPLRQTQVAIPQQYGERKRSRPHRQTQVVAIRQQYGER